MPPSSPAKLWSSRSLQVTLQCVTSSSETLRRRNGFDPRCNIVNCFEYPDPGCERWKSLRSILKIQYCEMVWKYRLTDGSVLFTGEFTYILNWAYLHKRWEGQTDKLSIKECSSNSYWRRSKHPHITITNAIYRAATLPSDYDGYTQRYFLTDMLKVKAISQVWSNSHNDPWCLAFAETIRWTSANEICGSASITHSWTTANNYVDYVL